MTPDLLALANEVDRLFRARQRNAARPNGQRHPAWSKWSDLFLPAIKEERTFRLAMAMEGKKVSEDMGETSGYYRTRRHCILLAVAERSTFDRSVVEMDERIAKATANGGDWDWDPAVNYRHKDDDSRIAKTASAVEHAYLAYETWKDEADKRKFREDAEAAAKESAEIDARTAAFIADDADAFADF